MYICTNYKVNKMKRILLAIVFACFTLALAAQEVYKVKYQGDRPTIADFADAIFTEVDDADVDVDDEELEGEMDESFNAIRNTWLRYRKGLPQNEGDSITLDQKNGFICYEFRYEDELVRIELCYWNEADQKHKLIGYNVSCFTDGKYSAGQFDGLVFYRYDNAKKEITWYEAPGFDVEYGTEDGAWVYYDLPRSGKNITVNYCYDNGTKKQKTLKFDGSRFSF